MTALPQSMQRLVHRNVSRARYVRARVAELVPSAPERCGRSPVVGAPRVVAASLRHLRGVADVAVKLDGGAVVGVDLGTPHGRRLYGYGFCEPSARFMRSVLAPGDVAIDGGANIGLFTLLAATAVGSGGRVIACEPSPPTMRILAENVGRNSFDWVQLQEVALASAPGKLMMHVFEPGSGFSSFAPQDTSGGAEVEVEVATLDAVAADVLDRLKLVKLDVEGAELHALRGASQVLRRARPDFIVEIEPEHLERQGCSVGEVQSLFEDEGYVGFAIEDGGLRPLPRKWHRPAGDPNIVVRPAGR